MLDWIDIKNINNDYFLTIPIVNQSNKDLFESSNQTIDYICKKYTPPYTLMVSGGVDSQTMLYLWKKSGVPFNALSVRYNDDLNSHDLKNLKIFSAQHNIDVTYYDFDILDFFKKEYFEYVEKYRCGSPHICSHMKFSTFIKEGTAIYSGNFLPNNGSANYFVSKNHFGLYRYAKIENKSLIPFFLCETMDLSYSFKTPFKDKDKNYIFNGIPIIKQETHFTGFEKIKDLYDTYPKPISRGKDKLVRLPQQQSSRMFDVLLRNKFEYKFRHDKYEVRSVYVG